MDRQSEDWKNYFRANHMAIGFSKACEIDQESQYELINNIKTESCLLKS